MPHLQFETTVALDEAAIHRLTEWITGRYAELMATGTGHIAVTVRDECHVSMGRAAPGDDVAVLNADVRAGRSADQRETLAAAVIDRLADRWSVPADNVYVVFTEHPGPDFVLSEGPLASWDATEADEGAQ